MFCNEPIQKVYFGQQEYTDYGRACIDYYYDMTIHLSENNRLVMETAHFYISLETSGVFLIIKEGNIESIQRENEWFEPYIHEEDDPELAPWVDYEATLFTGERLLSVEKEVDKYILQFDDFSMKLIPHFPADDDLFIQPHYYAPVLGAERLIHKCKCGGTGILVIDFVNDYIIRCDKCHLGTWAGMNACDAIYDWNKGIDLHPLGLFPEESFAAHCHEKILQLGIEERYSQSDGHTVKCRKILAVYEEHLFVIESRYTGNNRWDFAFFEGTHFNTQKLPLVFSASQNAPIAFLHYEKARNESAEMSFRIGDKKATLASDNGWLYLDIS